MSEHMSDIRQIKNMFDDYVIGTYTRIPLVLVDGRGSWVRDINADKYLDFFPGWAVSGLGHCHPEVVQAVTEQVKKIIHVSNNYYNELQAPLAKKIIEYSFPGKVFFCNSGAEAVEGAIKLSRIFGEGKRYEIISFKNSFHGRTMGALSATGQLKYQDGFRPLVGGFKCVEFNDISAVCRAMNDKTVAVILELVQGEGGINIAAFEFAQELRKICDERKVLLIFDEVQTGMGRTGEMFCFKHYKVEPDIMTLAKSLGGGLPIGAFVASLKVADMLKPGMHASTFGGSPIVCAASLAVFQAIEKENLLANARTMGKYLRDKLEQLKSKYKTIKEVRGLGLMLALEMTIEGKEIVERCLKNRLLINCTHNSVLRIMPAITTNTTEIDIAVDILDKVLAENKNAATDYVYT
ncbi:MAG: aspartate aminotransferase family protein [Candidatus Omnitrophota bacterium]